MIKYLMLFLIFPLIASANVEEIVSKIKEHYANFESFNADFEQNFYHKAYKKNKKSKGTVSFKKELKMKWSYNEPERKYIISNGDTLWIYEPENEQVIKSNVKGSELNNAAKVLFGKEDLFKEYNVELEKAVPKYGKTALNLTPKSKDAAYKKIVLYLNENYDLTATDMIDGFDNINTIVYKNIVKNQLINDIFFNFTIPEGVEVIEQDKVNQ